MADPRLNARQLEVLHWIADGCSEGVMQDFTYKTTAVALKNRHLVTISKRDGTWRAEVNDAGRHYLEHGEYPNAATPAATTRPRIRRPREVAERAPAASERSAAALDAPADGDESVTPPPAPSAREPEPPRVPVPGQLRRPHPIVAALRDDKSRFPITAVARNRALRIIQGLISASEREGYIAREVPHTRDGYGRVTWDSKSHFLIDTGECKVGIRMVQDTDRSPHVPTAYELAEQKRSLWPRRRLPKYDHTPSERLRLELDGVYGRQARWNDGTRAPLEHKLPKVLEEIAALKEEAKQRRIAEEQREAERRRQWEAAMARAHRRLVEAHRAQVLMRDADNWRNAGLLREYLVGMREAVEAIVDEEEAENAREWLAWASGYVERLDPLKRRIAMPTGPEPTPKALEPFLDGWSPYGPGGRW